MLFWTYYPYISFYELTLLLCALNTSEQQLCISQCTGGQGYKPQCLVHKEENEAEA